MKEVLRHLRPFLRGLPIIIFCMVVSVLVSKKYLTYLTPKYESTAKIKLADLGQGVPNNNLFKDLDVFASTNKIAAEIELMESSIMLSKSLLKLGFEEELYRVGDIRNQELYYDAPIQIDPVEIEGDYNRKFQITVKSEDIIEIKTKEQSIEGRFGDTLSIHDSRLCITKNDFLLESKPNTDLIDNYEYVHLSHEKLIEKVRKNLTLHATDKDVPVIAITYKSAIPIKSADFSNELAKAYITDYIETKYKAAETTVSFLDDRINKVANQLRTSETDIERYKNRRGIIDLRQESETDLRKIAQMKIQLSNLKLSLNAIQELEANLRKNIDHFEDAAPNFQAYTDLLSAELVKKIKALQAEKHDLLLEYTPSNPKVKVVDEKLEDLKVYLIEGVTNSRRNIQTQYQKLQEEIETAEIVFDGFATKQKDLTVMNRDFNIYEKSYNFLNEKRIEAEIARAAKISFHRIISPAIPSVKPVSPNKPIIIIVSAMLALLGSLAAIQIVHTAKGKVNDLETIESQSNIPLGIKTPFFTSQSEIEEHFLREAIQLEIKDLVGSGTILCLSSQTNNEGRQLHTKGLAQAFTKQGRKTLVLDMNGDIQSSTYDKISLTENKLREMKKADLKEKLLSLTKGYEIILIDNEPFENERIGLLLMNIATNNLYVLDARRTPSSHIEEINLLQDEFKIDNLSFILNKHLYNPSVIKHTIKLLKEVYAKLTTKLKVQKA